MGISSGWVKAVTIFRAVAADDVEIIARIVTNTELTKS